jgi:hypothetical protein
MRAGLNKTATVFPNLKWPSFMYFFLFQARKSTHRFLVPRESRGVTQGVIAALREHERLQV